MEFTHVVDIAVLLHLQKQGVEPVIDNETMFEAQSGKYRVEVRPENGGNSTRILLVEVNA
jgi:hypothetical protein